MEDKQSKRVGDGGAKQQHASLEFGENPALQKENRQAVKNQSTVTPEDYPDRAETVAKK
jgi:hypothetical protein